MERTDRLTKAIAILLFITLLAYIGYYIWDSVTNPVQTALAVKTTVTISTPASGIVVRDETVLTSNEPNLYITASDGKQLAVGAETAKSYSDEAALERAGRVRELQIEISLVESALYGATGEDTAIQAEAIEAAVLSLTGDVSRREYTTLDADCLSLATLVMGDSAETATQEQLDSLKRELTSLLTNSTSDTKTITTDRSGLFSTTVDGWEEITLDDVSEISTSALSEMLHAEQSASPAAYGKLITSFTWYFAAAVDSDYASDLSVGTRVTLTFGRQYSGEVSAKVYSIGPADENGDRVVVFSCTSALADTLSVRKATAEIVLEQYSGIRVPTEAIFTDDDGQNYIYVMTGLQAERKDITIIYQDEDFCVADIEEAADSLREGNEIIVSAKDLYDGKVMG